MPTVSLRFQKCDSYDNYIFIANSLSEEKEFKVLKKIHKKLSKISDHGFLPVYTNDKYNYSTIRFKGNSKFSGIEENDVFKIEFKILKRVKQDGTSQIYLKLVDFELISKAVVDDEVDLDAIDSDSDVDEDEDSDDPEL